MRKPLRQRCDEIGSAATGVLFLRLLKNQARCFLLSLMHKCSFMQQPRDVHLSAQWFLMKPSHWGGIVMTQNSTPWLYWCPMLSLQWKSIPIIVVQRAFSDNPVCTVPERTVLLQKRASYLLYKKLFKTNIHESRTNMHRKGTGRPS